MTVDERAVDRRLRAPVGIAVPTGAVTGFGSDRLLLGLRTRGPC